MVSTLLCLQYQHSTTCCVFFALFSDMLSDAPLHLRRCCAEHKQNMRHFMFIFLEKN